MTEDLTLEQLENLLETINRSENIQAANLMKMALFTGMRRGELFRLKWNDIDFEEDLSGFAIQREALTSKSR